MADRSVRTKFSSISASSACKPSRLLTVQSTSAQPSSFAASSRCRPAIRVLARSRVIGLINPTSAMLFASSATRSGEASRRPGLILISLIWIRILHLPRLCRRCCPILLDETPCATKESPLWRNVPHPVRDGRTARPAYFAPLFCDGLWPARAAIRILYYPCVPYSQAAGPPYCSPPAREYVSPSW